MLEKIYALTFKKYSLNSIKVQFFSQILLSILISMLSLLHFKLNTSTVHLSLRQVMLLTAYTFMIGGLLNSSIEVENLESKTIYLLVGNKNRSTSYIVLTEVLDCIFQSILSLIAIILFFYFVNSTNNFPLIDIITFIVSAILCFEISYYLTLLLKSAMSALAILAIFQLLVLPYIERVFPRIVPYIYNGALADSFSKSGITTSHLVLFCWNIILFLLIYVLMKKRLKYE